MKVTKRLTIAAALGAMSLTACEGPFRLLVPESGLNRSIVNGTPNGQQPVPEIDAGSVVNLTGCKPGGCTIWLAGHYSTRGAVFASLPNLDAGDHLVLYFDNRAYDYVVTGSRVVPGGVNKADVIHGPLVLQTSVAGNQRLLVYAEPA